MAGLSAILRAGVAGGAAGGGLNAGGVKGLYDTFTQTVGPANDLAGALHKVVDPVKALTGHATAATAVLGGMNATLGKLVGSLSPATAAGLSKVVGGLEEFERAVLSLNTQFVGLFSPATAGKLTHAVRDLNAAFGEQLVPASELATDVIRGLGDAMASITPVVRPVVQTLTDTVRPAFESLGAAMRESLAAAQPLIQLGGLTLAGMLKDVADFAGDAARGLALLLRQIRQFLGLPALPAVSSVGKAFAHTGTTSPTGLAQRLQESAYAVGREAPADNQLTALRDLVKSVDELPGKIADAVINKAVQSISGLKNLPPGVIRGIAGRVAQDQMNDAAGLLRAFMPGLGFFGGGGR